MSPEGLIQPQQLMQLLELAQEHGRKDLVDSMYKRLVHETDSLNEQFDDMVRSSKTEELLERLHTLKNCFANLGGKQAAKLLDLLYLDVKQNNTIGQSFTGLKDEFAKTAKQTIELLSRELSLWTSH